MRPWPTFLAQVGGTPPKRRAGGYRRNRKDGTVFTKPAMNSPNRRKNGRKR